MEIDRITYRICAKHYGICSRNSLDRELRPLSTSEEHHIALLAYQLTGSESNSEFDVV
jgi:hypothetical protein